MHNRLTKAIGLTGLMAAAMFGAEGRVTAAPAAAGTYIQPTWSDFSGPSFSSSDYLVATYYFYWYDVVTGAHIANSNGSDALTEHPDYSTPAPLPPGGYSARPPAAYGSPPNFSFQDPDWHARELQRMSGVHIDIAMPVYWGVPGQEGWSNAGLRALETAMDSLEAGGQNNPSIGLFYDTSTLGVPVRIDLSTQAGKDQFYGTIRDFYSLVPPWRWARIDGRALVWLYSSSWPARIDPAAFQQAADRFAADFGGVRLFFVGDGGWRSAGAPLDWTYAWGAAVSGPILNDVAELGPGYNDSAVIDRPQPLITSRRGGSFYSEGWETVHQSGRHFVALETWNEFHEGTEIASSYEYGTQYLTLTAQNAQRHKFPAVYVQQAYRYVFARDVDPSGYGTFTGMLDRGATASAVRDALVDAAEFRSRFDDGQYVTFLYQRYLGRAPDPGGYQTQLAELARGTPRHVVRDNLLDSAETRQTISDDQFVRAAYDQILGRPVDPTGYADYTGRLASGTPRPTVRDFIINSVELRYLDLSGISDDRRASLFDFSAR